MAFMNQRVCLVMEKQLNAFYNIKTGGDNEVKSSFKLGDHNDLELTDNHFIQPLQQTLENDCLFWIGGVI